MDEERDLVEPQTVGVGRSLVMDCVHALELEKVIARAERPDLARAALLRTGRERSWIGALKASLRFGQLELLL